MSDCTWHQYCFLSNILTGTSTPAPGHLVHDNVVNCRTVCVKQEEGNIGFASPYQEGSAENAMLLVRQIAYSSFTLYYGKLLSLSFSASLYTSVPSSRRRCFLFILSEVCFHLALRTRSLNTYSSSPPHTLIHSSSYSMLIIM